MRCSRSQVSQLIFLYRMKHVAQKQDSNQIFNTIYYNTLWKFQHISLDICLSLYMCSRVFTNDAENEFKMFIAH